MNRRLTALAVFLAAIGGGAAVAGAGFGEDDPDRPAQALEASALPPAPARAQAPARRANPRPQGPHEPVPSTWHRPRKGVGFAIARVREGRRVAFALEPGGPVEAVFEPRTEFGSPQTLAVVRREGRSLGVLTPLLPNGRLAWIEHDPRDLLLYWTRYSLHTDLSERALEMRYGRKVMGRFLVTVGGPGTDTPSGRFAVTDALSYDASPYYGCCALALDGHQTRLPPGWLGGDRIAIHGTPGPVGYAASHGCIRATDDAMRILFDHVPLGAPVFIRG